MSGSSPVAHYTIAAAHSHGWPEGLNHGEAKVALALSQSGVCPSDVEVQFRIGPYRLDFAFVRDRIAIEADGWVHTAGTIIKRDRARDKMLRSWGWEVIRIDTQEDVDAQLLQGAISVHAAAARERTPEDLRQLIRVSRALRNK